MRPISLRLLPIAALLVLILLAAGCGQASAGYDVSIDQALADWKNKTVIILDVRTPGEYRDGHIPGARLIPLDELPNRLHDVPKEEKVYVICRSGNRSMMIARFLEQNGFGEIYNLNGGMTAWSREIDPSIPRY